MPTWPASLPSPLIAGLESKPAEQSISTQMETGPSKRRRRFSTAFAEVPCSLILTGTQLATLRSFHDTDCEGGSIAFTLPDPETDTTRSYQFLQQPAARPLSGHPTAASRRWTVQFRIERVA